MKSAAELDNEAQAQDRLVTSMNERHRRSYLRKLERGDVEGAAKVAAKAKAAAELDNGDFDDNEEDDFSDFDDALSKPTSSNATKIDLVAGNGRSLGLQEEDEDQEDLDEEAHIDTILTSRPK